MANPQAGFKSAAKWMVRKPAIGRTASRALQRAGFVHLARRVSLLHGVQAPSKVTCLLPTTMFAEPSLALDTAHGRDQVALKLWTHGWDGFEPPLPSFFAAVLADGDVLLDVGANTGYYALLAASIGSRTQAYAFEPFPQVINLLNGNLAQNPQGCRVHVVPLAVSDTVGDAELYIPSGEHGFVETSASLERDFRAAMDIVMVSTTTLDEYTADLPQVSVIKIDVESAEHRVLTGARETLRRHRPIVFCEILDNADSAGIEALCRDVGYISVRLRPGSAVVASSVASDGVWRNQALWPAERIDKLQAVCHALGYRLYRNSTS